jgi:hypothetical protein
MTQSDSGKPTPTMAFDLFSPFVAEGRVDSRLLEVLGLGEGDYSGTFEKVLHPQENTSFDFYLEADGGLRIFFDVKRSGESFGICDDDERNRSKLEQDYKPHLAGLVDSKWLQPDNFFANYEVLRNLSYLGRYPDSGVVFIFPKANEALMKADGVIKQIVSKSLAPRVAILYLEFLVERILEAVADDEPLRRHYLSFRDKYVFI